MKLLSGLFFLWILNIQYEIITAQGEFPALTLVHDGVVSFDVVDHVTEIEGDPFKFILLACPMENQKIKENAENQLEKSLEVVQFHKTTTTIKTDKVCKKKIEPNVMHKNSKMSFTFGYKLYLSDEHIKLISDILQGVNEGLPSEPRKGINDQLMKTDQPNFFWYVVTNIDIMMNKVIIADHRVDNHNYKQKRDLEKCENYNLGSSLLEDKNIANIYKKEYQNSVLNQFKKPAPSEIAVNEMYLVELQLTPIDDFDSLMEREATCSYINVRPMWATIAENGWQKVEKHVKNIADYTPMEVTSGTYGILKLPETANASNKKEVVLQSTVVPEVFWKLVKYYDNNAEKTQFVRQGMLVITYNYVSKSEPHTLLCVESICQKSGWQEVENDDYKTGFTYCCSPKEELLKKLGLEGIPTLKDMVLETKDVTDEVEAGIEAATKK